ncbi:MAG TPA: hypothetical protein VNH41_05640 [Steroidobacteraceae bacterium]|nr:hypothetical protein [Steroidobacteraceae bacterium]
MAETYEEMIRKVLPRFRKPVEIDQGKLAEDRRRGDRAQQLLADEDLKRAFDTVEAVYMHAWRKTDATDMERRERAWQMVTLLGDLRTYLITCVERGDAARETLERAARQV